jgi:hypothetical protein
VRYLYIFPCVLLLLSLSCKEVTKPVSEDQTNKAFPPQGVALFYASLSDSLPQEALDEMNLGDVTGIKLKYLDGHDNRYFEYIADKQSVISAISKLPFTKFSTLSDSRCRKITHEELLSVQQKVPLTEFESAAFFWNLVYNNTEIYECIKSPYRHTLLINPDSDVILHRIEVIG